jgi:3-hydroxybutyryl-CoA dehydratase
MVLRGHRGRRDAHDDGPHAHRGGRHELRRVSGVWEEIFINDQYAREHTIFNARVVPGLCILVAVEGLYVLTGHTHHGRAYLGLDELRLVAPVVCGDTIRAEVTVDAVRPTKRPEHGILTLRHRVLNQDDVEVMTYKTTRMMERRPA